MPRDHFATNVLLPIAFAMAATLVAVIAFVFWSTTSSDDRARQRETRLVERVISETQDNLPHQQESVTVWDDAMIHVVQSFDRVWYDGNIGYWMFDYFGHDETILLDPDNRPVDIARQGISADLADYDRIFKPALTPLIASLRAEMATVPPSQDFEAIAPPVRTDIITFDGVPGIVAVAPMVNSSGRYPQQAGREFILISVIYLNNAFADEFSSRHQLDQGRFTTNATPAAGMASLPIYNRAGRFITFFEWMPDRPGTRLLTQTAPVLIGAFLLAGLTIVVLLGRLRRYSETIEEGRRAAQYQATHDALTGLPNRYLFEQRLAGALSLDRPRDKRLALLMLDLDRFKQVNDTHGHQAGDQLIKDVGDRLTALVGAHGSIARLGGDEFGILLPDLIDMQEALVLANSIVEAIGKPFVLFGKKVYVGASIGISFAPQILTDASDVTRMADIALYEAKAAGRNQAVIFQDHMRNAIQNRAEVETELRDALRRNDQISIEFQPLYGKEPGAIIGAEALARWKHPVLGQVPPTSFIPVAESTGLIEELGELILRRACLVGAFWPGKTIAVNISPAQLRNPRFFGRVMDLLAASRMRPSDLELEITEGILLAEDQATAETLHRLRAAGIRIALDDFGTGYSSLGYLRQYAVDRIKIDRSFISEIVHDDVSRSVVRAMIDLAHAMGAEVTAEGVETAQQHDLLTTMGCDTFQGYLFSPPVKTDVIETMLRDQAEAVARTVA